MSKKLPFQNYLERNELQVETALRQPQESNTRDADGAEFQDDWRVQPETAQAVSQRQNHADDGQLPRLHAQVEADQPQQAQIIGQPEVEQYGGEAEAVDEAEGKGQGGAALDEDRVEIVQGRSRHRSGDGGFHPARGQGDKPERRQAEGDGMRQGEGGDDLEHIPERAPKTGSRPPFARVPDQRRRQ